MKRPSSLLPHLSPKQRLRLKQALPRIATALAVLLICIGGLAAIFLQQSLRESQDLRREAAIEEGPVKIRSPQNGRRFSFNPGTTNTIQLEISSDNVPVEYLQLVFIVTTDAFGPPFFDLNDETGLVVLSQELEQIADGYLVSVVAAPAGDPFQPSGWEPLAELAFTQKEMGTVTLSFDDTLSTANSALDSSEVLNTVAPISFAIGETSSSPEAVGGPAPAETCNQRCSSNDDCGINQQCFETGGEQRCRLVTNLSSTTCENVPEGGLDRTCNEYCANTAECATGFTCWNNRCRHPQNVESSVCLSLNQAQQEVLAAACNSPCTTNNDCAINLRCYSGACRLATNPTSMTCSTAATPTISATSYQANLQSKGFELPLPAAPPSPTPTAQPSPTPQPSPTAQLSPSPAAPTDTTGSATTDTPNETRTAWDDAVGFWDQLWSNFDIRSFIPWLQTTETAPGSEQFAWSELALPVIALIVGGALLLATLLYASWQFLRRPAAAQSSNRPARNKPTAQPPSAPPTAGPPPLPTSPVPRQNKVLGVQPASAPPQARHQQSQQSAPAAQPPQSQSKQPGSNSMVERLKAKGVQAPGNSKGSSN